MKYIKWFIVDAIRYGFLKIIFSWLRQYFCSKEGKYKKPSKKDLFIGQTLYWFQKEEKEYKKYNDIGIIVGEKFYIDWWKNNKKNYYFVIKWVKFGKMIVGIEELIYHSTYNQFVRILK